jgi:hypothetical protein
MTSPLRKVSSPLPEEVILYAIDDVDNSEKKTIETLAAFERYAFAKLINACGGQTDGLENAIDTVEKRINDLRNELSGYDSRAAIELFLNLYLILEAASKKTGTNSNNARYGNKYEQTSKSHVEYIVRRQDLVKKVNALKTTLDTIWLDNSSRFENSIVEEFEDKFFLKSNTLKSSVVFVPPTPRVSRASSSSDSNGGGAKKKHNGRSYVVRTGSRGGKYILVKGKKIYV